MTLADEIETMIWAFAADDSRRDAVRDLAKRVDFELREKNVAKCAACDWRGTADTTWDELHRHLESCEKHPLPKALKRADAAEAEAADAKACLQRFLSQTKVGDLDALASVQSQAAAMRAALEDLRWDQDSDGAHRAGFFHDCAKGDCKHCDEIEAALSSDAGKGWVSPDAARQALEALERLLHATVVVPAKHGEPAKLFTYTGLAAATEQVRSGALAAIAALKAALGEA